MPIPIFIGVGQRYKPEQDRLLAQVLAALTASGLEPTTLPHTAWDETFPLAPIQSSMRQCFGVVVIAFPRITEKPVMPPCLEAVRMYGLASA